ncbi:MAG TPA: methyltransferase domain-containing protein [Egibacteraceae bacterium]|nr:methyltransferase domain-containing protein [Egibacteraceae bacterium]
MTTTPVPPQVAPFPEPHEEAVALAERLFGASIGAFELVTVQLGVDLGLYAWLAQHPDARAADLAGAAGVHERYAREWLEQQAAAGIVSVDDPSASPEARRYRLPAGHAEALLDEESLAYIAPLARFLVALPPLLPDLEQAYRSGTGLAFGDFGEHVRIGQAGFNRPSFTHLLTSTWLPDGVPDVHQRLEAAPPARVLDVACGAGWSSIALARGYPTIHVDGIDLDAPAIEQARATASALGLEERVEFDTRDAADPPGDRYEVAFVFEALHDLPHPVETLRAIREVLADDGCVIVMDERVGDEFAAPADDFERFLYAASVLHCLPVGMSRQPSAATGTLLRPATLRAYGNQAGFSTTEILPIDHDFFRFYRLLP